MANHIGEVAQMLGVEIGEAFKVTDDTYGAYQLYHRFTESNGIEISDDGVTWERAKAIVLKCLLMGDARIVKLPWKPKIGEKYYAPFVSGKDLFVSYTWDGDEIDKINLKKGVVCKTPEEAAKITNKMLAAIKEK